MEEDLLGNLECVYVGAGWGGAGKKMAEGEAGMNKLKSLGYILEKRENLVKINDYSCWSVREFEKRLWRFMNTKVINFI